MVSGLQTASESKWSRYDKAQYDLHDNCKGGMYYWAQKTIWSGDIWFYFLKQIDTWGLQFHCTQDLTTDKNGRDISLHPDVTNFIPGGLAVTMGSTFVVWKIVRSIDHSQRQNLECEHNSDKPKKHIEYEYTITRKVGYVKESTSLIERNWTISTNFGN